MKHHQSFTGSEIDVCAEGLTLERIWLLQMGKVEFMLSWTDAVLPEDTLPSCMWNSYEPLNYYRLPFPSSASEGSYRSLNVNCCSFSRDLHLLSWIPQRVMNLKRHFLPLVQFYGRIFLSGCFKHLYLKVSSGLSKTLSDMRFIWKLSCGQG